jgi:hypothetical protein
MPWAARVIARFTGADLALFDTTGIVTRLQGSTRRAAVRFPHSNEVRAMNVDIPRAKRADDLTIRPGAA